jgi:hypothetical protein
MGPFDAFCSALAATPDYEQHTPDVRPGSPSDIDEPGATLARGVDAQDASFDRPYHFGIAPFSGRSDAPVGIPGPNNTYVSSLNGDFVAAHYRNDDK